MKLSTEPSHAKPRSRMRVILLSLSMTVCLFAGLTLVAQSLLKQDLDAKKNKLREELNLKTALISSQLEQDWLSLQRATLGPMTSAPTDALLSLHFTLGRSPDFAINATSAWKRQWLTREAATKFETKWTEHTLQTQPGIYRVRKSLKSTEDWLTLVFKDARPTRRVAYLMDFETAFPTLRKFSMDSGPLRAFLVNAEGTISSHSLTTFRGTPSPEPIRRWINEAKFQGYSQINSMPLLEYTSIDGINVTAQVYPLSQSWWSSASDNKTPPLTLVVERVGVLSAPVLLDGIVFYSVAGLATLALLFSIFLVWPMTRNSAQEAQKEPLALPPLEPLLTAIRGAQNKVELGFALSDAVSDLTQAPTLFFELRPATSTAVLQGFSGIASGHCPPSLSFKLAPGGLESLLEDTGRSPSEFLKKEESLQRALQSSARSAISFRTWDPWVIPIEKDPWVLGFITILNAPQRAGAILRHAMPLLLQAAQTSEALGSKPLKSFPTPYPAQSGPKGRDNLSSKPKML